MSSLSVLFNNAIALTWSIYEKGCVSLCLTRDGAAQGARAKKKTPVFGGMQNFEFEYLVSLQIAAKRGALLDIRSGIHEDWVSLQ